MGTWALSFCLYSNAATVSFSFFYLGMVFIFLAREKYKLYYERINFYNGGIYHEKD